MTRHEIIDELRRRKRQWQLTHAYCETTEPVTLRKWIDHKRTEKGEPILVPFLIPTRTTLKIVMISRLGDFGLTDNLEAENGYHLRLPWESEQITHLRLEKDKE